MSEQPRGSTSPGDTRPGSYPARPTETTLAEILEVLKGIDEKIQFIVNAIRDINARG
jgi:hypothetical protein